MKKLLALCIEQFKFRHAMNKLAKQEWSVDFIIYLLRKSQIQGITMRIREPGGRTLEITANDTPNVNRDYLQQERKFGQDEWDALLGVRGDINA